MQRGDCWLKLYKHNDPNSTSKNKIRQKQPIPNRKYAKCYNRRWRFETRKLKACINKRITGSIIEIIYKKQTNKDTHGDAQKKKNTLYYSSLDCELPDVCFRRTKYK